MPPKDPPKGQLNVRVPPEVVAYVKAREKEETWKPALQVVAGLLALEALPESNQGAMVLQAMRALKHGGALESVLAEVRSQRKAIDEKVLRKMTQASLGRIDVIVAGLRQASG